MSNEVNIACLTLCLKVINNEKRLNPHHHSLSLLHLSHTLSHPLFQMDANMSKCYAPVFTGSEPLKFLKRKYRYDCSTLNSSHIFFVCFFLHALYPETVTIQELIHLLPNRGSIGSKIYGDNS